MQYATLRDEATPYRRAQAIYDGTPPPSPGDALDPGETAAVRSDLEVVVGFAAAMHAARTARGEPLGGFEGGGFVSGLPRSRLMS